MEARSVTINQNQSALRDRARGFHANKFVRVYLPYLLLALVLLVLHWDMSLNLSDDGIFQDALNQMSLPEYMAYLYLYVNGKVFPDSMAALFTWLNPWVWKTIDILMYLIIAACMNRFFAPNSKTSLPGCLAVLLLPFSILNSAGWVATSTNYIWTTAALLVALVPLLCAGGLEKHRWFYLFCFIGCLYASNQEQSGAILVTLYAIAIAAKKYSRQPIDGFTWISFLTSAAGIAFVFTAPGHRTRASAIYSIFVIPEYLHMSLLDKLIRGFTATAAYLFSGNTAIWLVFCLLLFLAVVLCCKDPLKGLISAFPLLYNLGFGVFKARLLPQSLYVLYIFYPKAGYTTPDYPYLDAWRYTEWTYYLPLFLAILTVGVILLSILWLSQAQGKAVPLFLAFSAGLCSRLVMGFSPTLYGSGLRTFTFFYFALEICAVLLLDELGSRSKCGAAVGWAALALGAGYTFHLSYLSIM